MIVDVWNLVLVIKVKVEISENAEKIVFDLKDYYLMNDLLIEVLEVMCDKVVVVYSKSSCKMVFIVKIKVGNLLQLVLVGLNQEICIVLKENL